MRQFVHVIPETMARSRVLRLEFALLLVRQAPERTAQPGPRSVALVRWKSSEKRTACPPGVPASGEPASGTPASGVPPSGTPASGDPAAAAPETSKLPNQTPARFDHIPALPAAPIAWPDESVTITFAAPFTEPVSFTAPAPEAVSEMDAQ